MAPTITAPKLTVQPQPLTPSAFAPFGTVISSPLPPSTTTIPTSPPPYSTLANQNTALKYSNVAPLASAYRLSPSGAPAEPRMSLFSCFPRTLRPSPTSKTEALFDVDVLEQHAYTTQTFIPLSTAPATKCIVIVAPTLDRALPISSLTPYFPQALKQQAGAPDLANIKAFVAEPGMGVTYGIGAWHAPMVVVGEGRVDYVVTQYMSGRADEDVLEVELVGNQGEGVQVVLDVGKAGAKAKL